MYQVRGSVAVRPLLDTTIQRDQHRPPSQGGAAGQTPCWSIERAIRSSCWVARLRLPSTRVVHRTISRVVMRPDRPRSVGNVPRATDDRKCRTYPPAWEAMEQTPVSGVVRPSWKPPDSPRSLIGPVSCRSVVRSQNFSGLTLNLQEVIAPIGCALPRFLSQGKSPQRRRQSVPCIAVSE
jgi:hypothetical protein